MYTIENTLVIQYTLFYISEWKFRIKCSKKNQRKKSGSLSNNIKMNIQNDRKKMSFSFIIDIRNLMSADFFFSFHSSLNEGLVCGRKHVRKKREKTAKKFSTIHMKEYVNRIFGSQQMEMRSLNTRTLVQK